MSKISVKCVCDKKYLVSDEHVGKRMKCKACGKSMVVGGERFKMPQAECVEGITPPPVLEKGESPYLQISIRDGKVFDCESLKQLSHVAA